MPTSGAGDAGASDADAAVLDASDGGQEADIVPPLTWTAVNANIIDGDLVSVWGTSATDLYVGTDQKSVYHLVHGSSTWTGLSTQVIGGGWGADVQTVYAAGASAWLSQMGVASGGGLFHYAADGLWISVASGTFYSVWGSSGSDVYAVGDQGVFHALDGGAFASEDAGGTNVLSVSGSGPGDVFIGTTGTVAPLLHSSGDGNWAPAYPNTGEAAWAVWSSSPGDVYAIFAPLGTKDPPTRLVHSSPDGGWLDESVSSTPTTLVTLWGSSKSDVYAGGWHVDSSGKTGDLYHSTGTGQWTRVSLPGQPYDVRSVWGTGPSDVYVGAFDGSSGPVLLHGQR
jgi:hypothetical protein